MSVRSTCLVLALAACGSHESVTTPPPPPPPGSEPPNVLSATVDGQAWIADSVVATYVQDGHVLVISAWSSRSRVRTFTAWIQPVDSAGTYSLVGTQTRSLDLRTIGDSQFTTINQPRDSYLSSVTLVSLSSSRVIGSLTARTASYPPLATGAVTHIDVAVSAFDIALRK